MTSKTQELDTYDIWREVVRNVPVVLWILIQDHLVNGLPKGPQLDWHLAAVRTMTRAFYKERWTYCQLCGGGSEPLRNDKNPLEILSLEEERFVRCALLTLMTLAAGVWGFEQGTPLREVPYTVTQARSALANQVRGDSMEEVEEYFGQLVERITGDVIKSSFPESCPRCKDPWGDVLSFPSLWGLKPVERIETAVYQERVSEAEVVALILEPVQAAWGRIPAQTRLPYLGEYDSTFSRVRWRGQERKVLSEKLLVLGAS